MKVALNGLDSSGNETYHIGATVNGELKTADIISIAGQNRAQSVLSTSVSEALGGATILTNRKVLSITPMDATVYWGFTNTVTTVSGIPIFKNQTMTFSVSDTIHIYLISAINNNDCRIMEGS